MDGYILELSTASIKQAVKVLSAGEVIGFVTETVFGIGADARNPDALNKIYELKGRPKEMPLQVLVKDRQQAEAYGQFSAPAGKLASVFWPGALTLIVPAKPNSAFAPQAVSASGIGFRAPNHPVPAQIIEMFGAPIAATSANPSGTPPATSAREVLQMFGAGLALVIDGSSHPAGKASTVVDGSGERPKILREGAITEAQINAVWG